MPILLIHICYSLRVKNCKQGTLDSIADHMCYELNVCIPQNSYAEAQPPKNVKVFREEVFVRWSGLDEVMRAVSSWWG